MSVFKRTDPQDEWLDINVKIVCLRVLNVLLTLLTFRNKLYKHALVHRFSKASVFKYTHFKTHIYIYISTNCTYFYKTLNILFNVCKFSKHAKTQNTQHIQSYTSSNRTYIHTCMCIYKHVIVAFFVSVRMLRCLCQFMFFFVFFDRHPLVSSKSGVSILKKQIQKQLGSSRADVQSINIRFKFCC